MPPGPESIARRSASFVVAIGAPPICARIASGVFGLERVERAPGRKADNRARPESMLGRARITSVGTRYEPAKLCRERTSKTAETIGFIYAAGPGAVPVLTVDSADDPTAARSPCSPTST